MKKIILMFCISISILSKTIEDYHFIIDSYLVSKNVKNKETIEAYIMKYSKKYNVNPLIVTAMIQQESRFKHNSTSGAGAIGILQLMPFTAKDLGVNPYNLEENIAGGVKYFSYLLEENKRDVPLSLASYNAGLGAVQKYDGIPPYEETQGYVKNIMETFAQLNSTSTTSVFKEVKPYIEVVNTTKKEEFKINPEILESVASVRVNNDIIIEKNNIISYNKGIRFYKAETNETKVEEVINE